MIQHICQAIPMPGRLPLTSDMRAELQTRLQRDKEDAQGRNTAAVVFGTSVPNLSISDTDCNMDHYFGDVDHIILNDHNVSTDALYAPGVEISIEQKPDCAGKTSFISDEVQTYPSLACKGQIQQPVLACRCARWASLPHREPVSHR